MSARDGDHTDMSSYSKDDLESNLRSHINGISSSDGLTSSLNKILNTWHESQEMSNFYVIPLENRYKCVDLRLENLKNSDLHRVSHLLQICAENGNFYMLLANMKLRYRWKKGEGATYDFFLTRIVDVYGLDLTLFSKQYVLNECVLAPKLSDDRRPHWRGAGAYWGFEYAADNRIYKDSAIVIARKRNIIPLLIGSYCSGQALERLLEKAYSRHETLCERFEPDNFLMELCDGAIHRYDDSDFVGPIAVTALKLKDADLFVKAVKRSATAFSDEFWVQLGQRVDLASTPLPEEYLIEALAKSENIYGLHSAIAAFRKGSQMRSHYWAEAGYREGWLTMVLMTLMETISTVAKQDPRALVNLITEQRRSYQQFVIFQCVRKWVTRMPDKESLPTALLVELCARWPEPCHLTPQFCTLIRIIAEAQFPGLTIGRWVNWLTQVTSNDNSKLASTLYEAIEPQHRLVLLEKLGSSASMATQGEAQTFFLPFLEGITETCGDFTPEAQACLQAFMTQCITCILGIEPRMPTSWRRVRLPDSQYRHCECFNRVDRFLEDPERKAIIIACPHDMEKDECKLLQALERDVHHVSGQYNDGAMTIVISKTMRRWENSHAEWNIKAEEMVESLRKLSKLQQCLADGYEDILTFSTIRVQSEDSNTSNMGKRLSVLPQKRKFSEV